MSAPAAVDIAPSLAWTPRAVVLLASGAALLGLGLVFLAPGLLFVGLPLLLAPIAASLVAPSTDPSVDLTWAVEGIGRDVDVVGELRVPPPVDPADLEVAFSLPPGLRPRDRPAIERDPGRIRFRLHWEAVDPLVVPVPPPRVVWRDPAGLVERRVTGERPPLEVERYPPEVLRAGAVRLERTIALPGEVRSRSLGPSGEFFGLRDAAPAEPPRRLNWIASARAGRPIANDYRVDRTGDVVIVVDARPTSLGPRADASLLALSVAGACGIAESFLRERARVGVAIFGEFLDAVPLGSGRAHRLRLRSALLAARLATEFAPAERCAIAMRRYFPPGVTTLVISSLADPDSIELVAFLRRRGFPVTVLSPSPLPPRPPGAMAGPAELADRIARLARRVRIARAWQEARVVDWDDRWSLAPFVALLRRPDDRRRIA
jgi:uncharacterized protein (DUF58 family)